MAETNAPGEDFQDASGSTHSNLSGTAKDVVQARDVHGGVHFHTSTRAAGPVPRQLPRDVRGFIGREQELARLDSVLAEHEGNPGTVTICAIIGTAGVGKTSLALHWAHKVQTRFPDGELYVNLRGYDTGTPVSPAEALEGFLRALDVPPTAIPTNLEARSALYRTLMAGRRALIVADNAASVRQVRPLLPGTGESLVMVTSRSRLSGLMTRDGAQRLELGLLTQAQAIDLVQATTVDYRRGDDPSEVAELVGLCARLPLALCIAAERAAARPLLPLRELIADLHSESSLWQALSTDGDEDADAVRSVFAWSYRALSASAARLFRLLGLHPGPEFSTPAAAALHAQPDTPVAGLLDVLVGAHLLEQTAPDRYQFHDLLRAYAADQAHDGDPDEARKAIERVTSWYLHSAAAAAAAIQTFYPPIPLPTSPPSVNPLYFSTAKAATGWYHAERVNLRAAAQAATETGLNQTAWQLPAVLEPIYGLYGPFDDWIAMGQLGLAAARHLDNRHAQGHMLACLGVAATLSRHLVEAEHHLREALDLLRDTGDQRAELNCVNSLGWVYFRQRRLTEAISQFRAARPLADALGDGSWEAALLNSLARAWVEAGDTETAIDLAHRALHTYQGLGADRRLQFGQFMVLARAYCEQGHTSQAASALDGADRIATDLDSTIFTAELLLRRAHLHAALHHYDEALTFFQRAALAYREFGEVCSEAQAIDGAGEVHLLLGQPEQAIAFHRRAATVQHDHGEAWYEALALSHLAEALDNTGQPHQAANHRQQALTLLEAFPDQRATALRESLRDKLDHPPSTATQAEP